jgi:hypothetical protein
MDLTHEVREVILRASEELRDGYLDTYELSSAKYPNKFRTKKSAESREIRTNYVGRNTNPAQPLLENTIFISGKQIAKVVTD